MNTTPSNNTLPFGNGSSYSFMPADHETNSSPNILSNCDEIDMEICPSDSFSTKLAKALKIISKMPSPSPLPQSRSLRNLEKKDNSNGNYLGQKVHSLPLTNSEKPVHSLSLKIQNLVDANRKATEKLTLLINEVNPTNFNMQNEQRKDSVLQQPSCVNSPLHTSSESYLPPPLNQHIFNDITDLKSASEECRSEEPSLKPIQAIIFSDIELENTEKMQMVSDSEIQLKEPIVADVAVQKNIYIPLKKRKFLETSKKVSEIAPINTPKNQAYIPLKKRKFADFSDTASQKIAETSMPEKPEELPQEERIIEKAQKVSETGGEALEKYDVTPRKKFNLLKKKGFPSEKIFEQIINPKVASLRDDDKNSLLHFAAADKTSLEHVKVIVENGCDIDLVNNVGNTALHIALENNNRAIARFLMKLGAKGNIKNNLGIDTDSLNPNLLRKTPIDLKTSHSGTMTLSRTRSGKNLFTASASKQGSKDIEKDISNIVKNEHIEEGNKITQKRTFLDLLDDSSEETSQILRSDISKT